MSLAEQWAKWLDKDARQGPDGNWYCKCPTHTDGEPSFSLKDAPGARPVPIVFRCWRDCDRSTSIAEFQRRGWWPLKEAQSTKRGAKKPEKDLGEKISYNEYDYRDADGTVLYQSVAMRYTKGKKMWQRRPDGSGGWINSLGEIKRVLFMLPELLAAVEDGESIFIVEGEEKVKLLRSWGLHATCNPQGAGKWDDKYHYSDCLKGAQCVYVLPDYDADGKGMKHAETVCRSVARAGIPCKLVHLPGLEPIERNGKPKGQDVVDWAAKGNTAEQLWDLCAEAPAWTDDSPGDYGDPADLLADMYDGPDHGSVDESQLPSFQKALITLGLGPILYTDTANGRRLIKLHGEDLKYTKADGWRIWDGRRWKADSTNTIVELAKETAEKILDETSILPKISHKKLRMWAEKSLSAGRLKNMIDLASSEPNVVAHIDDFDSKPYLVNCANGVFDIRTMKLMEHSREAMCSKMIHYSVDLKAECPRWLRFLERVMDGDWDMVNFLQRAAGVALTGYLVPNTFIVYGGGRNGKSIFLNTLLKVAGEYGASVRSKAFMKKYQENAVDSMAQLIGARFVGVNEIQDGDRLDEQTIKDWTGGERINFKKLYREPDTFKPTGKLFFRGNYLPDVRGTDTGIWERMLLIEFNVTIPIEERDPHLEEKLDEEMDGILTWCLIGAHQWYSEGSGLNPPTRVIARTQLYQEQMDTVGEFLRSCCVVYPKGDPAWNDHETPCSDLYRSYEHWARKNGYTCYKQRRFGAYMTQKQYDRGRAGQFETYRGMKIRPEYYVAYDYKRVPDGDKD